MQPSYPMRAILALDKKDRERLISARLNEMEDWFNRLKRNRGEYSIKECDIKTMMDIVGDSLAAVQYYKGTLKVKLGRPRKVSEGVRHDAGS